MPYDGSADFLRVTAQQPATGTVMNWVDEFFVDFVSPDLVPAVAPDFVGQDYSVTYGARDDGITVTRQSEYLEGADYGLIHRQDPAAGTAVDPDGGQLEVTVFYQEA